MGIGLNFGGGKVSYLLEAKELEGPERVHKMEDPDILEVRAVKKTGFAYKRDLDLKPSEEIEFSKLASLKEVAGEVEPVEPSAPSLPAAPDPAPGGVPAAPPAPGIALDESSEPLPKQKCVAPALPAPLPPPLATASAAPAPAAPPAPIPVPASGVPVAQDPAAVIAPVPAAAPVLHEIPAKPTQTDQVNFSAMAQGQLEAGAQFILDIWAHTESQTEQVKMRANEMRRGDLKGTKQGVGIVQGSVLEVHLSLPGFEVADPVDLLTWNGEPVQCLIPGGCTQGLH